MLTIRNNNVMREIIKIINIRIEHDLYIHAEFRKICMYIVFAKYSSRSRHALEWIKDLKL